MKIKNQLTKKIVAYIIGVTVAIILAVIGKMILKDQYLSGWVGATIFLFIINWFDEKNEDTEVLINKLSKELEDEAYYQGWRDNISMSYQDNERWYCQEHNINPEDLDNDDKRVIANKSAEYFINQLTK